MTKRTVTVDTSWIGGAKGKALGFVLGLIVVALIAFSVGHDGGYKEGLTKGLEDGNKAGFDRGDRAGFENGYWSGREDGCLWVIDSSGKQYVIGSGNPFTTWYYLMDLGSIYITRSNCSTDGHGNAPYEPSTYVPSTTDTN